MREKITNVNHNIIKWARLKSGYSLEDIAKVFNKKKGVMEDWEAGIDFPTYIQLEKLAEKYGRSVAFFFISDPPKQEEGLADKVMLRSSELVKLKPKVYSLYRQAFARQLALEELFEAEDFSNDKIFNVIQATNNRSFIELAAEVREYLGVSIEDQMSWKDTTTALQMWRDEIHNKGIFVFKEAFDDNQVDGFCLTHKTFPVIYLNNTNVESRQIFTLFHELAHLLLGNNGITSDLTFKNKNDEQFCNHFSSEFLVPLEHFSKHPSSVEYSDEAVSDLANEYKVSLQVILYKFRQKEVISEPFFQRKLSEWIKRGKNKAANSQSSGGGNYYYNQIMYLGRHFLTLAFKKHYEGKCSVDQLASYFNVQEKNISKLEDIFIQRIANA
ncbi:MAG: XRE family transcriptional regulator [Candidatus Poribacteria bacterium]|nr:XRE family transcriptional regulator [Candidatus Poribacteria bacterium]